MTTRLPTRNGIPMWIPTRTVEYHGEIVQLYKVYINNKSYERTKGQIMAQISEEEKIASMDISDYMKSQYRRASIREFKMDESDRLAKYLARLPGVVQGMLAIEEKGAKLPPGFKRRLNLIQQKLSQMSINEREQFYFQNRDLFEDSSDWYNLTKRYAHMPADMISLDEKDIQKLEQMGFSNLNRSDFKTIDEYSKALYSEYINNVFKNLGEINEELNKFMRKRR